MRTPHRSCMLIHAHAAFLDVLSFSTMFYLFLFAHARLVYKHDMYHSKAPELFWSNTSVVLVLFCLFLLSLNLYYLLVDAVADIRTVLPLIHSLHHCVLSRHKQPLSSPQHVAPLCFVSVITQTNFASTCSDCQGSYSLFASPLHLNYFSI